MEIGQETVTLYFWDLPQPWVHPWLTSSVGTNEEMPLSAPSPPTLGSQLSAAVLPRLPSHLAGHHRSLLVVKLSPGLYCLGPTYILTVISSLVLSQPFCHQPWLPSRGYSTSCFSDAAALATLTCPLCFSLNNHLGPLWPDIVCLLQVPTP